MPLMVGTSGWSYKEWEKIFYPSSKTPKLSYYSQIFGTAEIDSTFYANPKRGIVFGWANHGLLGSGIELGSFPVSATKVRDKADELALRPACRSQGNEQPFGIPPEAGPVGSFPNVRHSPHILRLMIARFSANGAANAVRFAQRLLRDRPAGALRPIRGRRLENELSGEGKPPKNPMRPSLGRWSSG